MGSRCMLGSLYSPYQRLQGGGKKLLLCNRCVPSDRGSAYCNLGVVLAPYELFALLSFFHIDRRSKVKRNPVLEKLKGFFAKSGFLFF